MIVIANTISKRKASEEDLNSIQKLRVRGEGKVRIRNGLKMTRASTFNQTI